MSDECGRECCRNGLDLKKEEDPKNWFYLKFTNWSSCAVFELLECVNNIQRNSISGLPRVLRKFFFYRYIDYLSC